ncbi:MAG: HAMP domain-containing sensor histidine kinase [Candidatus Staskawiczbacteria bacterium]|nr:HAMP domain-containing sensor histidine kinase [Candidatus Staskawiczbacteria bacterium]
MYQKVIVFFSCLLLALIILEPFLLPIVNPLTIYCLNILVALALLLTIILFIKKIQNEKSEKEVVSLTAHQLSAPLASIKWSLEMLLNDDFGKLSNEQKVVIRRAFERDDQLIYLVNDLLNASKIEERKYLLERKPCNIEDIVLSVSDFYKEEIQKKKISFKLVKLSEKFPKITIDGQKIKMAIQNLFDNAIKYTPAGGQITASLRNRGKYIELKIQDSGIGIEKKQQPKIFNKFSRGKNAIKHDPMGYGLGLFFVKNIVEAHGGKVWFKSKENEGSTFYVSFPVK